MPDVFISYPHQAADDAILLADALQARGVTTWYAPKDLPQAKDRKEAIYEALDSASAVAFLVTPHTTPTSWVRNEYMAALESYWAGKKKLLVPVLVKNAEPPSFLRSWTFVRVQRKSDWDRAAQELISLLYTQESRRNEPTKKAIQDRTRRLRRIDTSLRRWHAASSRMPQGQELDFEKGNKTITLAKKKSTARKIKNSTAD